MQNNFIIDHDQLTEVISACSCWLVGRLFTGVFPGVLFLFTFLTKQNTPTIAIVIARKPPPTPAISAVMLSVSAAKPFLVCALVLDSEKPKLLPVFIQYLRLSWKIQFKSKKT